ncbi:Lrp/AsnC family transcriptional regulator [Microvirga terrae]|uniref:Lrp/AsnC family transcriptional regulator n=1 Tax=Microvirga terrae TaxID=2740529 RepID=A0ABY5RPU9_9HYPH|nr:MULTISPECIES: Lrp/AsnC family transcriptional regulator [Microvirga]MBQ0824486.1 Lrp/AsnC family transcriptional regulator [Microvirga sp. HBU67558]UVF19291.1 Lrp/AsnC family transcriptional regulator [Microvirga terrae]
MMSLDETDRQILKILTRSGREPLKQLASAVGLSRSTLTARLRRLEKNGFIQGYCAVLSSGLLPRPNQAVLLVKLDKTPAYDIVDAIRQIDEVIQCRSVAGDIDLVLDVAADAVETLNKVRDRVSTLSGVADVRTHMVLATNFRTVFS